MLATVLAGATVLALAAMVGASPLLLQSAAAVTTPADDCRTAIHNAIADKKITYDEMQTIKAECANGGAPTGCLTTVKLAREDHVITSAEITAIKAACRIS